MKEEPAFNFGKMREYYALNRIYYPSEFMRLEGGSSIQVKPENTIIRGDKMKRHKEIRATDGRFAFWVEEEARGTEVFYEEYGKSSFHEKTRHSVVLEQNPVFTCRFFFTSEKEAEKASKDIEHFLRCSCEEPLVLDDVGAEAE